jgi:signal peptidase II
VPDLTLKKWWPFAVVVTTVVALDQATKAWALNTLPVGGPSREILGVPITLHFNTGGLWGFGQGGGARWFFVAATVVAMVLLVRFYHLLPVTGFPLRRLAIPMITAGAVGNGIDRLRWDRGVIDFIGPVDLGFMHWPIFNVADSAISVFTILLAVSLLLYPTPETESVPEKTGESGETSSAPLA